MDSSVLCIYLTSFQAKLVRHQMVLLYLEKKPYSDIGHQFVPSRYLPNAWLAREWSCWHWQGLHSLLAYRFAASAFAWSQICCLVVRWRLWPGEPSYQLRQVHQLWPFLDNGSCYSDSWFIMSRVIIATSSMWSCLWRLLWSMGDAGHAQPLGHERRTSPTTPVE